MIEDHEQPFEFDGKLHDRSEQHDERPLLFASRNWCSSACTISALPRNRWKAAARATSCRRGWPDGKGVDGGQGIGGGNGFGVAQRRAVGQVPSGEIPVLGAAKLGDLGEGFVGVRESRRTDR